MNKRETCFRGSIVITLDVTHIARGRKVIALGHQPDVLILLQEIIAVALDVFNEVIGRAVSDIVVAKESLDVACLAVAYDVDVISLLLKLGPCLDDAFVKDAAVLS